jgi:SAM-dependent methyltransferase
MAFRTASSLKRQQHQSPPIPKPTEYPGKELEAMALATNYRRWIMEFFKPFLGKHILEVGAGAGSFSEMLLRERPHSLTILEPSDNLYPSLSRRLAALDHGGIAKVKQATLSEAFSDAFQTPRPDTAVYINVLEHVEDDEGELNRICSTLLPGGRILIFVPAHQFLMSRMDREVGHFRRYSLNELQSKCASAGFRVTLARYFDVFGVLPWFVKYRLMKSNKLEPGEVRAYDRCIVPICRTLESFVSPPFGKNIILVGERVQF